MAEQPATATAAAQTTTESGPAQEQDASGATFFNQFLRDYKPAPSNLTQNVLENRYHIDTSQPLAHLNSKTAQAYLATDQQEPDRKLYALVCESATIPRLNTIRALKKLSHPNLVQLVTAGRVHCSHNGEVRYVIIHEQPKGKRLSEFLKNTPPIDEYYITGNIIAPLAEIINLMYESGLSHGRVNPDNVYMSDKAMLGECVSEPCGFSQPFYSEPLERIQVHPSAKGSGTNQDYYALGVLVAYILLGAKHFASLAQERFVQQLLQEGTYYAIIQNRRYPEAFNGFLRGTLHDNPTDRWGWKQLRPWLNGRQFHVLAPPSPASNTRPYEFQGKKSYSRREIAEYFFKDWVNIPEALRDKQFIHWVAVSLKNKPLSEQLERIIVSLDGLTVKQELEFNEKLMRILILLDPDGPIRMYPLSFFPDGLAWLFLEYFKQGKEKELNLLLRFLEQNMMTFWVNLRDSDEKDSNDNRPDPLLNMISRLDKMRVCLKNQGVGFGIERILYELNPSLPCQSPLVQTQYITSTQDLLIALDQLAPSLGNKANAFDSHIFGFLACKLGIQHSIRLRELESIPELAKNRICIALRIISMAQYRCGDIRLPGLSHWLALQLLPVFDVLKSQSMRDNIRNKLKESAASGYTQLMAREIIDSDLIDRDAGGYARAKRTYQHHTQLIKHMQQKEAVQRRSHQLGTHMAKYASYGLFVLALFMTIRGVDL